MAGLDEMTRIRYHSEHDEAVAVCKYADELMIANFLNVLNNPTLCQMLSEEEMRTILEVVKNHVSAKARVVTDIQNDYIQNLNRKLNF